ncbi:MAG: alpha/beta hydrolase [Roseovarius sp.]|nr:alpha/beta hydrolase [Roseovarius sp.]MCY4317053.1 alpha/beta hydrolase [Roseovarius sp.]
MNWLIVPAIAVPLLVAAPFIAEFLRPRMNGSRRVSAPGAFARLSGTLTHYQWRGPEDGDIVVCVHGLTTPSFVWQPIAKELSDQGYRVLAYDLPGRGYSDRPDGIQNGDFFVRHLNELLKDQAVERSFILCGYSMGGAIAAAYASRHPERAKRVVLLAPAGMGHDLGPITKFAVKHEFLGKWLFYAIYPRSLRKSIAAEMHLETPIEGMHLRQMGETRLKGFTPSVLSSLRGMIDENLETAHREIAKNGTPALAIWGGGDDVIPIQGMETIAKWNPDVHQHVVEDAGHSLAYTHHREVMKAIGEFLD